jgi:hypothetical protein
MDAVAVRVPLETGVPAVLAAGEEHAPRTRRRAEDPNVAAAPLVGGDPGAGGRPAGFVVMTGWYNREPSGRPSAAIPAKASAATVRSGGGPGAPCTDIARDT